MHTFFKPMFVAFLLLMFTTPANAALTDICNSKSGLAWDMNTEADMAKYTIYHSNAANLTKGSVGVVKIDIPHDPSQAIDNGDGTFTISHDLVLSEEGPRFFIATASDNAGNESGQSNEASCTVDIEPNSPTIRLLFDIVPSP